MKNLLALAFAVAAVSAQASLVTNGGFEAYGSFPANGYNSISAGTEATYIPGWTVVGREVAGIGPGYFNAPSNEIDLSGAFDQSLSGVMQKLATVPGQKVTINFDVFTGDFYGYNSAVDFFVDGNLVGGGLKSFLNNDNRKTYSYTVTAGAMPMEIKFLKAGGIVNHIDNVSANAEAVPEPATMTLAAAAVAGVIRRRRQAAKNA